MKKLVLAIALITVTTTFSQIKVRPGIKMGLNSSNITNLDGSSKTGFNGGLFVNIHLARFYELQVETTYSNQGFNEADYIGYDYYNDLLYNAQGRDLNIHYLSFGIANKFFIVPNTGLHLIVGPGMDINIDDNGADITAADLTLFGGIGYEFPFGLGIEGRYKQGLIDVREDYIDYSNYDYYNGNNPLNAVFQVGVYYKFQI